MNLFAKGKANLERQMGNKPQGKAPPFKKKPAKKKYNTATQSFQRVPPDTDGDQM